MKTSLFLIVMIIVSGQVSFAQDIGQQVKDRAVSDVNYKIDTKVDNTVDKTIDKADNMISGLFKKKNKSKNKSAVATDSTQNNDTTIKDGITAGAAFSDFVPGTTVIFQDNFEQDALADFPAQWNSTGSGKVSTLNGAPGKWLELADNTLVKADMANALPENCTIEFDLFLNAPTSAIVPFIQFGFSDSKNILTQDVYRSQRCWVSLDNYNDMQTHLLNYGLNDLDPIGDKGSFPLTSYANKILHVSIAINNTRLRVYFDKTKIIDLPKILTTDMRHTFYIANYPKIPASTVGLFIGNVRIASADVDARSLLVKQLLENGRATTSDILFDVNSDNINPSSYPILNQVGDALKSNPALKVLIVGHTDSDGTPENNLQLSKMRAAAVKSYLVYKYGIDAGRLQTDGKGATQPVASNNSPEGKAQNRRVEFIKL